MVGIAEFLVTVVVLYLAECFRGLNPDDVLFDLSWRFRYRTRVPILYPREDLGWTFVNAFAPASAVYHATRGSAPGAGKPREPNPGLPPVRDWDLKQAGFDTKAIQRQIETVRRQLAVPRKVTGFLFVVCFGVFPAAANFWGLNWALLVVTPLVFGASLTSAATYLRKAPLLSVGISKAALYGNAVKLCLYPISALRAVELLSSRALSGFDAIAVATVLCGKREGARLAAKELVVLRYRSDMDAEQDAEACRALREHRTRRQLMIEHFVAQQQLPVSDFSLAPRTIEAGSLTYCPCCGAQYLLAEGTCVDCPDILLQPVTGIQGALGARIPGAAANESSQGQALPGA